MNVAADGEFTSSGILGRAPTFAGLIAFDEVGVTCPSESVLFVFPPVNGTVPTASAYSNSDVSKAGARSK